MEEKLSYHPILRDAEATLRRLAPTRCLFIAPQVSDDCLAAGTARLVREVSGSSASSELPRGVYWFASSEDTALMVVEQGAEPCSATETDWQATDTHSLMRAFDWLEHLWEAGTPVPEPAFALEEDVQRVDSGEEARIRSRTFDEHGWRYKIRTAARTVTVREGALKPAAFDDDPEDWILQPPEDVDRFAATLTRAKLKEELTDTVYSFRATRTIFRPYQFRPLLRFLETGKTGLLIADEVGLGKTIEAGLLWTELDSRNQANRTLVVCPSSLVTKWQAEMEQRFSYELTELDSSGLDDLLERAETDRLPARYQAVCSLERMRMWAGLEDLARLTPRFDLVIVDEAHAFRNSDTRSYALGALLRDWSDVLVFLSATPLNLGNEDLYNLLELLVPGEFEDRFSLDQRLEPNAVLNSIAASLLDHSVTNATRRGRLAEIHALTFGRAVAAQPEFDGLSAILHKEALDPADVVEAKRLIARMHSLSAVVTRTRKIEVEERKTVRNAIQIDVVWTDAERALYDRIYEWQRQRALDLNMPLGFSGQMPLRLASSCLPAARDQVMAKDRAWSSDELDARLDDEVGPEEPPPADVVAAARRLGDVDTKFDGFLAKLAPIVQQGRRVLVFTFSRATLAYLERRLSSECRLATLHGGVNKALRQEVMQNFREHEYDVVLASRVASEGLDFEFCSAIVNYDLPWNPMEVEQRIGRIDRFGQTEEAITILNFHTPGTIEGDILERVHDRIGVFTDSIGELEPILESQLTDIRRAIFDFTLTDAQRARQMEATLAAVEERRRSADDVDEARQFLSSTDLADIEGLEQDLTSQGRYIGQSELVLLLQSWCETVGNASCETDDGRWLRFRGNADLEQQLHSVKSAGMRSASEIASLAQALRDEQDLVLCLDQELARQTTTTLLSANHPLVRAAIAMPESRQARFAHLSMSAADVPPGNFLVLLAIVRWTGLGSSNEIWNASVNLENNRIDWMAGPALLSRLAEADLRPGSWKCDDLTWAVRRASAELTTRMDDEEVRRARDAERLVTTRKISMRETHSRKVAQIEQRLATARKGAKPQIQRLFESQLANQDRLLANRELEIEASRSGALELEHLAVAVVEVTG